MAEEEADGEEEEGGGGRTSFLPCTSKLFQKAALLWVGFKPTTLHSRQQSALLHELPQHSRLSNQYTIHKKHYKWREGTPVDLGVGLVS